MDTVLTAMDVVNMTREEIRQLPEGAYLLKFSDGEIRTVSTLIRSRWYYWQLFKLYPGGEPKMEDFGPNEPFRDNTHVTIGSTIFWNVYDSATNQYENMQWDMSRDIYQASNYLCNDARTDMGEWVVGLDLGDYADIMIDPRFQESIAEYRSNTDISERQVYDVLGEIVRDRNNPKLVGNAIGLGVDSGGLPNRSFEQTCGPRGFVKEINGKSFNYPIDRGFVEGMDKLYQSIIESRSASLAYYMQYGPLEKSEYMNRQVQLVVGAIGPICMPDCGTKETIEWEVRNHDLRILKGKNYVTDDGQIQRIRETDEHLIGRKLKIRSITRCEANDPRGGRCEVCVGFMSKLIPPGDSLGHTVSIGPCSKISQRILSTKHLDISVEALILSLPQNLRRYARLNPKDKYLLNLVDPKSARGGYVARFLQSDVSRINVIHEIGDIREATPSRITKVHSFELLNQSSPDKSVIVPTTIEDAPSSVTLEFLEYMKKVGWESGDGYIDVPLDEWDYQQPFIATPRVNKNVMTFLRGFDNFLFAGESRDQDDRNASLTSSNADNGQTIRECHSVTEALQTLVDLLSPGDDVRDAVRIDLNLVEAEIFIAAAMCKVVPGNQKSYAMPKVGEEYRFDSVRNLIMNRSPGAAMAYQEQGSIITNPATYMNTDRPYHPLEEML